jgi:hypothetical protein
MIYSCPMVFMSDLISNMLDMPNFFFLNHGEGLLVSP